MRENDDTRTRHVRTKHLTRLRYLASELRMRHASSAEHLPDACYAGPSRYAAPDDQGDPLDWAGAAEPLAGAHVSLVQRVEAATATLERKSNALDHMVEQAQETSRRLQAEADEVYRRLKAEWEEAGREVDAASAQLADLKREKEFTAAERRECALEFGHAYRMRLHRARETVAAAIDAGVTAWDVAGILGSVASEVLPAAPTSEPEPTSAPDPTSAPTHSQAADRPTASTPAHTTIVAADTPAAPALAPGAQTAQPAESEWAAATPIKVEQAAQRRYGEQQI